MAYPPESSPEPIVRRAIELHIDVAPHIVSELRSLVELFTFAALHHRRARITARPIPRVVEPHALVIRVRNSIPLVEPMIGGPATLALTHMPFAQAHRRVARLGKQVTQRAFPGHQPSALNTGQHHRVVAGSDRITACQQRRPGRSALRLRRVVQKQKTFARKLIDAPRVRATQHAAAVAPQLAKPEVIDVKEDHIGPIRVLIHGCSVSATRH
jgi:hypothetical protein